MPGICKTALAGIAELKRDHGIEATPDEIVRLHEAGLRQENPITTCRLALIGTPVLCGSAVLFPLTIASEIWWRDLACVWWRRSDFWLTASLGFAMAHGRVHGHFQGLTVQTAARAAVRAWFRDLDARQEELDAAIGECLANARVDAESALREDCHRLLDLAGNRLPHIRAALSPILDAPAPERPPPFDWEEIVHELCAMTSEPAAVWLHTDRDAVVRAWIRASRITRARAGGRFGDSPQESLEQAIRDFRQVMVAIIRAHAPAPAAAASAAEAKP